MAESAGDVTELLVAWGKGNREALDRLMPLVYEALHRLAHQQLRRERRGRTLGTTGLVHEAYLRLVDQSRVRLENRTHFLSLAARMMRRVLVDAARKRRAAKRGSGEGQVPLSEAPEPGFASDEHLLALDEALTRLEAFDAHLSQVVEMRYFGGFTFDETAEVLGTSTTSAWRDWNTARAWLHDALANG
jgi:RNA polymerase sigma factor (TIGR02999 family)